MNKFSRRAGYLFLALAIVFAVIILNREYLGGFALKHLAFFYAGRVDIELDIGSVRGDIFTETILTDLSLRPADNLPQVYRFTARSIRCSYDLWDLRDGLDPFVKGLECSAEKPTYMQDLTTAAPTEKAASEGEPLSLPSFLPALRISNGSMILTGSGWDLRIEGMDSRLIRAAETHGLLLEAKTFRFDQSGITRIDTGISAGLHYTKTELRLDYLEATDKGIRVSGSLHLPTTNRDPIEFATNLVSGENRLDLAGSLKDHLLKAEINTPGLAITDLQKRLGGTGWDVSGQLRGRAKIALDIETGNDFEGAFDLAFEKGLINGVAITASATGKTENTSLLISAVTVEVSGNLLAITEGKIPVDHLLTSGPLPIVGGSRAQFALEILDHFPILRLFQLDDKIVPGAYLPDSLSLTGRLTDGSIHLEKGVASAADFTLKIVRGKIMVPNSPSVIGTAPLELVVGLETADLHQLISRFVKIPLSGLAGAEIEIKGSLAEQQGSLKLSGDDLEYGEKEIGSLALGGEFGFAWKNPTDIREISFKATELTQTNSSGTLNLDSPLSGSWLPGTNLSINGAFLVDKKGVVGIRLTRSEQKTKIEVTADKLDSDGWPANYIGRQYFFRDANLKAVYIDSPTGPSLDVSGMIGKGGTAKINYPLSGEFDLRYSAEGIEISRFNWQLDGGNRLTMTGHLPYDPLAEAPFLDGELRLKGNADFPDLEKISAILKPIGIGGGNLNLDLILNGSWDRPVGHISLSAEGIEPAEKLQDYFDSPINLTAELVAEKDGVILKKADLDSKRYSAEASGSIHHVVSIREILDHPAESLKGEVTLDAAVRLKDLNFLTGHLNWLRRLEGDMQGKIHVKGPIGEPAIKGSFSLKNGEAGHVFDFPPLSAVDLQADFDEHTVTINKMQAEMGGAPINLDGKIKREEDGIALDLHGNGQNVLLFRNNYMLMRGNVRLDLVGPLERLAVKGQAALTYGYYTRNVDFLGRIGATGTPVSEGVGSLFSFPDPPLKDAIFDIKITTIEPFRIKNNLVRGFLRPELTLKGTGELPYLVGAVYIDPSRIILPSGRLQIQSGLVRYPIDDPDRPRLDIIGRSKVMGYDINVVTSGPVSDPVITLSSNPALPNDELLLLLLTGQPPKKDLSKETGSSGTRNVMVYLGKDFLKKWLADDTATDDESVLDRFELDLGRNVTVSGEQTLEATFRLSKKVEDKGEIYYLSAEKDRYDAYNYGLKVVFRFE